MKRHTEPGPSDDWRPTCSLAVLKIRAAMLKAIRSVFLQNGYLEVETPLLSSDIVVDAHLHPFPVDIPRGRYYLQTSPEAGMKRLLAAGAGSIFQITRSFRGEEQGRRHNPEFTIIEWYGVESDERDQMALTEHLVREAVLAAQETASSDMDSAHSVLRLPTTAFRSTTYDQAFERFIGMRVLELNADQLRQLAQSAGVQLPDSLLRQGSESEQRSEPEQRSGTDSESGFSLQDHAACVDAILNVLLAECVEPHLGVEVPEFLTHYPASQAALAEICDHDPRTSRRFELYMNGLELCNGYFELTDPVELARRDAVQNDRRSSEKVGSLPGAPHLLHAMQHGLPRCAGVALGFDRLVMAALQTNSIDQVIPFPFARA
ncbi:MAG: EF-P lysine aminoacylase GenX [Planctomycetaceae bacterium]|nr:EF-P lysine aminoacylase GenX [Planctomycetaceae bacterium]